MAPKCMHIWHFNCKINSLALILPLMHASLSLSLSLSLFLFQTPEVKTAHDASTANTAANAAQGEAPAKPAGVHSHSILVQFCTS